MLNANVSLNVIVSIEYYVFQEVAKLKKNIQKAINQNIESEVSAKAQRFEEGKKFLVIGNPKAKTQTKKK